MELPIKRQQQAFLASLLIFIGGILAISGYSIWRQRAEAIFYGFEQSLMHSRSIADYLTDSLYATEVIAGNVLSEEAADPDHRQLERKFVEILHRAPAFRSLSLLDISGRIITSTNPANVGIAISTGEYLPRVTNDHDILRLGRPWAGRDFATGRPTTDDGLAGPAGASFIPAVLSHPYGTQTGTILIAFNTEYFVNHIERQLDRASGGVEVLLYDGSTIMGTMDTAVPGLLRGDVVRKMSLDEFEFGKLDGPSGGARRVLATFKTSRLYPFVVLTHIDREHALRGWRQESVTFFGVVAVALLVVGLLAMAFYRRQQQAAILRAEAVRLQRINATVFDSSTDAIIITDIHGDILSVNAGFTRITGYATDEVLGRNPRLLRSGRQDRDFYVRMWQDIIHRGIWRGEIVNRRKDGTLYDCLMTISAFRDEHGTLLHFISTSSDVTERKASENQLRKLSLAIDQSAASVIITDPDGRVEYVNDAFTRIMGFSRDEVIGLKPRFWRSPESSSVDIVALWAALKRGHSWQGEFHNRRKDGTEIFVHSSISPLRQPDGSISNYIAVQEDISEKKRLGAELDEYRRSLEDLVVKRTTELEKARQTAEDATKAKSEMLANVSHELRTPLNAIIGFSDLMRREIFGPIANEKYMEYSVDIFDSGQHLLELVNEILDLSAVEAGKIDLEIESLEIAAVAQSVLTLVRDRARRDGVTLSVELDQGLPTLRADKRRLKQILLNLLTNGIKFTPVGGKVSLRAFVSPGAQSLIIQISDNGIGMDAVGIAKAMTLFGQVDGGLSRKREGTGLGLPLTKSFVELHGGTLTLESVLGTGTTVTIEFPGTVFG